MPQLEDLFVLQRPSTATHHKLSWENLLNNVNNTPTEEHGVYVGETPPVDPHEGDLWYQPSTDLFQIYLVDLTTGVVDGVSIRGGGSGYAIAQNIPTTSGSGHELFIDILSADGTGKILSIDISDGGAGHGYEVGDVVFLYSAGHSNGSVQITSVSTNPVGTWTSLGDAGEY